MIKHIKVDDGHTIWLDWNDTTPEELNNYVCSNFDVINVPYQDGPNLSKLCTNYFVSYFKCDKSTTGYAAMFVNRNYRIYKDKIGYTKQNKTELNE